MDTPSLQNLRILEIPFPLREYHADFAEAMKTRFRHPEASCIRRLVLEINASDYDSACEELVTSLEFIVPEIIIHKL